MAKINDLLLRKNYYSYLADKHPDLTFAVLRRNDKTGANF
jgi:hypothetical protein